MLPNLVIAGVPKAGTTSIFNYLAAHPGVCGSSVKETRYFASVNYGEPMAPLEEYEGYFEACPGHSVVMEATPGYVQCGHPVAAEIDRRLPGARVLISLRDPVGRLISFYRFQKSTLQVDAKLGIEEYVERCRAFSPEEFRQRGVFRWTGLYGGLYGDHLPAWFEMFGERCEVIFFEELGEDPAAVTDRTLRWLDLIPEEREPLGSEVHNRTVMPRNAGLQRAGLFLNRRFEPFWHRHPELKRRLRSAYHSVNAGGQVDAVPDGMREQLRELYADSSRRTAELLRARGHEQLPDWLAQAEPAVPAR